MRTAWAVLIISAFTDFLITVGTALQAAMLQTDPITEAVMVVMPSKAAIIATLIGAVMIFARTIQQTLKTTPTTIAELKGSPQPEVTKQGDTLVTKITTPIEPTVTAEHKDDIRKLIDDVNRAAEALNKAAKE